VTEFKDFLGSGLRDGKGQKEAKSE